MKRQIKTKSSRSEKISEMLERIEKGVQEVFESENYRNYLKAMSKFHNYSYGNVMLIFAQRPDASMVAGYASWKKNFNRNVKAGEKGIRIIGYSPRKVEAEVTKTDSFGNVRTDKEIKTVPGFMPMYVYDYAQTEGEPLPQLMNELQGEVRDYPAIVEALKAVSPLPISFEKLRGEVKGYCSFAEGRIVINEGMSEMQNIKTMLHEISHSLMHSPENEKQDDSGIKKDRMTRELEAESNACIVASFLSLDTSEYSFPYLAAWCKGRNTDELRKSLEIIRKTSNEMITGIEEKFNEFTEEKNREAGHENRMVSEKNRIREITAGNDFRDMNPER